MASTAVIQSEFHSKRLGECPNCLFSCALPVIDCGKVGSVQISACANVVKTQIHRLLQQIHSKRTKEPPQASLRGQRGARSVIRLSSELGVKCPTKCRQSLGLKPSQWLWPFPRAGNYRFAVQFRLPVVLLMQDPRRGTFWWRSYLSIKIFYGVSRSSRDEFPDPLQSPPKTVECGKY